MTLEQQIRTQYESMNFDDNAMIDWICEQKASVQKRVSAFMILTTFKEYGHK